MSIGTPLKRFHDEGNFDVIVIGSGIGGLATAAMLAKHQGKRVLVLERHYTAGGFTHTFRRPDFEWDVGVHYIGEVHRKNSTLRRIFDHVTNGELEWADMGEVYDTIVIDGERYEFHAGAKAFRAQMCGYFPKEEKAIDRYLELLRHTAKQGTGFFAEKALPKPISALFGSMMRASALKGAKRTTLEVLRELTNDERLIGVLTGQWGDYGLPPAQSSFFMHSMVAYHYLNGGAYPVGGSGRIAESMEPLITEQGGAVVTSAEVAEILVRDKRAQGVRLADGQEFFADIVVSDAGVALTYGKLLPSLRESKPPSTVVAPKDTASCGHLCLYVGLNRSTQELGLKKTNLWIYPHHDHDQNVARFIADPNAPLPVAYLSFPSAKDPDFENRHPGKSTIESLTLAPYAWFAAWEGTRWHKRGEEYENFKQSLAERLKQEIINAYPQTKDAIVHAELSTPLTTQHFAAHPHGEIYGLAHTPERFQDRRLTPRTAVRGLYLTGADVCTAGIGGALFGGLLSASVISGRNMIQAALTKAPS